MFRRRGRDLLLSVGLVEEGDVTTGSPDVRAQGGEGHVGRNETFTVSLEGVWVCRTIGQG